MPNFLADTDVRAAIIALLPVIIAAVAGVGGALAGAWIGGRAARQVAEINLREARATRFSDRTRELAAVMLNAATTYYVAEMLRVLYKQQGRPDPPVPNPNQLAEANIAARELRLIVHLPETAEGVQRFATAVSELDVAAITALYGKLPDRQLNWDRAEKEFHAASEAFERAIRAELTSTPVLR